MEDLSEERLAADLRRAMKARDALVVSVLRGVVAAVKNAKVERRGAALSAGELTQIVRREIRKREEAAEFARQAGRAELVERNEAERAILADYVPAPPTPEAIEAKARELVAGSPRPDMGSVMRSLKAHFGGALDGRVASEIVRRVLAGESGPSA